MHIANEMPSHSIAYMLDPKGRPMIVETGNTVKFLRKYAWRENLQNYPWVKDYDPKLPY